MVKARFVYLKSIIFLMNYFKIVEVDEIFITRRKYGKGRLIVDESQGMEECFFGGVERGNSDLCFVVPVKKRSKDSLLSLIKQFILPGKPMLCYALSSALFSIRDKSLCFQVQL